MTNYDSFEDISVEISDDFVATVEIQKPPLNFFDIELIRQIGDAFDILDEEPACRAIVLCAAGKTFCAGANFGDGKDLGADGQLKTQTQDERAKHLYVEAVRLFANKLPIIGAIHGAAIGGGLGLAMVPDFRVTCPEARFSANFTRLGFHPGFGLSVTLTEAIGKKNAALMFYSSRRFKGEEAYAMGLADVLVPQDEVRFAAQALAAEIAQNAPLAIAETRQTMRGDLAERVRAATDHELEIQTRLRTTSDFKEGIAAMSARRVPNFTGE